MTDVSIATRPRQVAILFLVMLSVVGGSLRSALASAAATTTTLTVTSAGNAVTTVPAKSVITLTATVMAGSAQVKVGRVNFCDATSAYCTDIHLLGTAQLTSAGTAVMKFIPGIGTFSYKAVFLGTATYASSSSSNSALTVAGAIYPTSTMISQSGNPTNFALKATESAPVNKPMAAPTGVVSFVDTNNGNSVLASAELGAGVSRLDWFNSQTPSSGGAQPLTIAVGDFNADGILDLAVANGDYEFTDSTIAILLGKGDGTFHTTQVIPTPGDDPSYVVVADFNGDGIPDLAVTYLGGSVSAVAVFLGNGDGTFTQTPALTSTGSEPRWIAVGDFNGDGKADLAVAPIQTPSVTILLGNGDGTFTHAPQSPSTGAFNSSIVVGDFNGDDKADLAVPNDGNCTVSILLGNGDGSFTATPTCPQEGGGPNSIVIADFNGDGKADLAYPNYVNSVDDGSVTVLLGNGDGTFTKTAVNPTTQIGPTIITAGDFNGDGIPDLAVANQDDNTLTILLGNGDGTFTTAGTPPTGITPQGIAVGDFNGDGLPDLGVANTGRGVPEGTPGNFNTVTVLLTQLTQTATATVSVSLPGNTGTHQVVASYPGDDNYGSSISAPTGLVTSAQISLSPTSLSFGTEPVGSSSGSQNVLLTNTGGAAISIGSLRLTGTNATSFATSNLCSTMVAAGGTCRIGARFAPTATGDLTATITLIDNVSGSPQAILSLSGTGITAPTSSLSLSASSLAFGSEPVGSSTGSQNVILTNTGTVEAYISSFTLTGANAASFATSNTCGNSLAAGASCRIGARFVPTVTGPLSAAITITDNATGSPQTISLSGTGITAPTSSLSLSASSLAFGSEPVGSSTGAQNVILTNTGTVEAYISGIALAGANAASFATSNTCGFSLAARASCRIGARFVPTVTGPMSAAITITDNATGSPQTILLSGTGQ